MSDFLPIIEPGLPLTDVSEGEQPDPYDYFDNIVKRLKAEQPALMESLATYIEGTARDSKEVQNMLDVMAITYRTLEAQAEADALKSTQE